VKFLPRNLNLTVQAALPATTTLRTCDGNGSVRDGHPLGASGSKLTTTLIQALNARGGRFGLQAMCEGGGLANLIIVENLA